MSQGLATPFLAGQQAPTVTTYTSGSGTYTVPSGVQFLVVEMCGGGGGGGGAGTGFGNGGTGGTSTFGSWTTIGGNGGTGNNTASTPATGGTGGTGGASGAGTQILRVSGGAGGYGVGYGFGGITYQPNGGGSRLAGGACQFAGSANIAGLAGLANGGGGGGGAAASNNSAAGSGGGAEQVQFIIFSPAATYSYAVGAGGTAGAGAAQGGAGGSGVIVIYEYYSLLGITGTLNLPLAVDQGGTGRTSATAYGVLCGGTTSTGAQQSIASVGTSGQVLTSNGAGALPTFQANAASTGAAKAWVNFNGTGTVAIQTSFNVTSITDNTTGDYTVNFTTAFSSANYSVSGACADTAGSRIFLAYGSNVASTWTYVAPTTTALRITVTSFTGIFSDASIVNVACFGNQ